MRFLDTASVEIRHRPVRMTRTLLTEKLVSEEDGMAEGASAVRGTRIGWTAEGSGPLVVWAHGMTNDRWALERAGLYDWRPVVEAGHRLVRYDARGHGESGGGTDPEQYTWSELAEDLLALADDLSPDAPLAAMGSSMGSATLLTAALRRPDRFSKLVLTAPPTAWATRERQAAVYEQSAAIAERDGAAAFGRLVASQPRVGLFRDLPDYPPKLRVRDELLPSVLRGGARSDLPPEDEIRRLRVPTLVLSYADDPGHPVSTGERLAELIPGAEFGVAASVPELRTWGDRAAAFLS